MDRILPLIIVILLVGAIAYPAFQKAPLVEAFSVNSKTKTNMDTLKNIQFKLYRESLTDYPLGPATHAPTSWAVDYQKDQEKAALVYNTRIMELLAKESSEERCRPTITGSFLDCGPYGANVGCYESFLSNQYAEVTHDRDRAIFNGSRFPKRKNQ